MNCKMKITARQVSQGSRFQTLLELSSKSNFIDKTVIRWMKTSTELIFHLPSRIIKPVKNNKSGFLKIAFIYGQKNSKEVLFSNGLFALPGSIVENQSHWMARMRIRKPAQNDK